MPYKFSKLKRLKPAEVPLIRRDPVDPKARAVAEPIVEAIRTEGEPALRRYAEQFGEITPGAPLVLRRDVELLAAWQATSHEDQATLKRTAARIRAFARAQRATVTECTVPIPGGEAGHTVEPVEAAGCYAPGGRYPLPSTVLMTAITARVAGCKVVRVASPKPLPIILAAAYVAEADELIPVGGAHAIAALAYGAGAVGACDAVCGPGNMYVTAAKALVSGRVAIDMLAGPSECQVIADADASAKIVAHDLLAQSEHDPAAIPILITTSEPLAAAVDAEILTQLKTLSTAETAEAALENGYTVVVDDIDAAADMSDRLAVEHVEVMVKDPIALGKRLKHYGGLFVGEGAAEVLGDYGAGPNHTLPTGGTARSTGGLSVFTFLRVRTWMRVDDKVAANEMVQDCVRLGEIEGLFGHAAAARARLAANGVAEPALPISPSASFILPSANPSANAERLMFGVPKKGRLNERCLKFLEAAGLDYHRPDRVDVAQVTNLPITLVFLPAADIAQYVGEGDVDLGITGEDIIAETGARVNLEMKLGFGKCKLAVQVPKAHKDAPIGQYAGARVVTSFPNITHKFFAPLDAAAADGVGRPTQVKYVSGSVESAIQLGLADAVVDLVETGTTMHAAGLDILTTIMETEATLISNPHTRHPLLVAKIKARIQGYLDSIKYEMISYNVERARLPEAVKVTPGKKSPTVTPLDDGLWVAVSALVHKKKTADIIDQLVAIGATDILVFTMRNCRV